MDLTIALKIISFEILLECNFIQHPPDFSCIQTRSVRSLRTEAGRTEVNNILFPSHEAFSLLVVSLGMEMEMIWLSQDLI